MTPFLLYLDGFGKNHFQAGMISMDSSSLLITMNDRVFRDTNIPVPCFGGTARHKKQVAVGLVSE